MRNMTLEELQIIAQERAEYLKRHMYKSELKVWDRLQEDNCIYNVEWKTQVPIIIPWDLKETYNSKAFYIVDFIEVNTNVIIEVDGEQHDAYADSIRDGVLLAMGYITCRIKSLDVWHREDFDEFINNVYLEIFYRHEH
jgi:very-short-patch-repair endonuclease